MNERFGQEECSHTDVSYKDHGGSRFWYCDGCGKFLGNGDTIPFDDGR